MNVPFSAGFGLLAFAAACSDYERGSNAQEDGRLAAPLQQGANLTASTNYCA
ncbi:MAG: hypothetical protein WCI18_15620 [Pseudomonadota bacterium]